MPIPPVREWCTVCQTLPIDGDTHSCKEYLRARIRTLVFTIQHDQDKKMRIQEQLQDLHHKEGN